MQKDMSMKQTREGSVTAELTDELLKDYAKGKDITIEDAKVRVAENYKKEVEEVDAKEVALKCMEAIRQTLPKVHGLELREMDAKAQLSQLQNDIDSLKRKNTILEKIAKESVATVNQILLETQNRPSIFERLWKKITK